MRTLHIAFLTFLIAISGFTQTRPGTGGGTNINYTTNLSLNVIGSNTVAAGANVSVTTNVTGSNVVFTINANASGSPTNSTLTNLVSNPYKGYTNGATVAAGVNVTVTTNGTGPIVYTISAVGSNGGSSVSLPLSSVQFNSNGVMQGSSSALIINGAFTGNGLGLTNITDGDSNVFRYAIAAWGDSLTLGMSPYLAALLPTNYVLNRGIGGQTSVQISNRFILSSNTYGWPSLIWVGANDYPNLYVDVTNSVAGMVSALTTTNYIIMGMTINTNFPLGTAEHNSFTNINKRLEVQYGSKFWNVHQWLVAQANTNTEYFYYTSDIVAPRFRTDLIHLNALGYGSVATQLVLITATNWGASIASTRGVSDAQLLQTLANPPPIGPFTFSTGYTDSLSSATAFLLGPLATFGDNSGVFFGPSKTGSSGELLYSGGETYLDYTNGFHFRKIGTIATPVVSMAGTVLPATVNGGSGSYLVGYQSSGAKINQWIIGDGGGYSLVFSKRTASTTTDLSSILDNGIIYASQGYTFGPSSDGTTGNITYDGANTYLDTRGDLKLRMLTVGYGVAFNFSSTGRLGIGTATPSSSLDVIGGVRAASGIFTNSIDSEGTITANQLNAGTIKASGSAGLNNLYLTNLFSFTNGAVNGYVLTTDGAGVGTWQASSGGSTFSNKSMFYVSMTGDNSTAKEGRLDLTYRDPFAAANAATNAGGGTVLCFPGIFTTNNLLRRGVNWYGYPGAVLNYVDNGVGAGRAIFDDRDVGAVTNTIGGYFDIRYSTGLTGYNVGTALVTAQPTNIANLLGAIGITNPATRLNLSCSSISVTSLVSPPSISAVYVANCAEVHISCPLIVDPIYTNTFFIGNDDVAQPLIAASTMVGIYWKKGDLYVNADVIRVALNAVYADEPVGTTGTNNLWVTAAHIENNTPQHTVYLVGRTPNYKVWIDAKSIVSVNAGGSGVVGMYNEGRFYIKAEKIASENVTISCAAGTQIGWITAHKIASKAKWCFVQGGTLYLECPHYDDLTGITQGWDVSAGELIAFGGVGKVLNGTGLRVTGAGMARFKNVTIDTSTANLMTNTPVFVSTNGVILNSCVLVAPVAAPAVMAVAAQSVLSYIGVMANKTNHPNITVLAGPFTTDANVR